MRTDLFDFDLPEERIALQPARPRDQAKLLLVEPAADRSAEPEAYSFQDLTITNLPQLLRAGDALVFNDTKVLPAALSGIRHRGDIRAKVSFNLHKRLDAARWLAFARPAKKLAVGDRVQFGGDEGASCMAGSLDARVEAKGDHGAITLAFSFSGAVLDEAIKAHGAMPLPPYIASKRSADARDEASYQTIFARHDGAVAAPTAGLHFTHELMAALAARGVSKHFVTLHVGAGTFLPVKVDDTADHIMHAEWGEVSPDVADELNEVRRRGGRIIAVGTTSLRLLESATKTSGAPIKPFIGDTDIFITPGYRFRAADLLWTNFHLPRSTLFMLVSAFSGLQTMHAAYAHAIASQYRFYSYGDASLLYPSDEAKPAQILV